MPEENRSEKRIRVAVFGAGKMGLQHAKAVTLIPKAELVAISDPVVDPEIVAKNLSAGTPFCRDAAELMDIHKPDVVHICTPPHTHIPLAMLAVEKGADVYVEKPFALTAQEAEELIGLAQRLGRKVCAGHQLLFERPAREALALMEKIGRIVHIESCFAFRPVRRAMDGRSTMPPIDQLLDILPHPVYLLLHFLEKSLPPGEKTPVELRGLDIQTSGNVHAILRCGKATGTLNVTLEGRPVESYVKIVGVNGCVYADFVRGMTFSLPGPGTSGPAKALNPYSQARQTITGTTRALARRLLRKQKSYPGLIEIFEAFYDNIEKGTNPVPDTGSILETVRICEMVGMRLKSMEKEDNFSAQKDLEQVEQLMPKPEAGRGCILVTGGTGMLGKAVAAELRKRGWPVRIPARRIPPAAKRIPGAEYIQADLGDSLPEQALKDVEAVIHCAAETAGGREAHIRNSIEATRNLISAMDKAGVKKLVNISSIAVLESSTKTGRPVDETTPMLSNTESRGPYVWGKAESEILARNLCDSLGIAIRTVRPGPLVDYDAFEAPGRLGREVGTRFVMAGSRGSSLSLCRVDTAAKVLAGYIENFDQAPDVLNLLEPEPPTRGELAQRLLAGRPDLKVFRVPFPILWTGALMAKALQRILRPGKTPIDLYGAFVSERYKTDLAAKVIRDVSQTSLP